MKVNVQAAGVKKLVGFLAFLLLFVSFRYAYDICYRAYLRIEYEQKDARQPLLDVSREVASGIGEAERKGKLKAADFEKLDFYGGDADRGWNPSGSKPLSANNALGTIFPLNSDLQKRLNLAVEKMTVDGQGKVLINIRRFPNRVGEPFDDLTLIVTNVKDDICASREIKEMLQLEILPDNHSVAIDESEPKGCVKNQHNLYYFQDILTRNRDKQDNSWVMLPDFVAQPPNSLLKLWGSSKNDE